MAESVVQTAGQVPAAPAQGIIARHVLAAVIGNALEFYDFVTFAFFSISIGHAFFPSHNAYASLMQSLAIFGAGFLTRPLGAFVIGAYADRVGRRPAMMLSFTLMGVAIITMALIPSYSVIGIAAPILAIITRMAQGFSLGGEVGTNTAYLMEASAPDRRGLIVSWQGASQGISAVVGGLVGVCLSAVLSASALDAYGWRIAFLLGGIALPFGLLLRRTMPETLHVPEPVDAPAEPDAAPRSSVRIIVLSLMILGGGTIGTYVADYMTTFAQGTLHMSPTISFAAVLLPNLAGIFAVLFGGWLSDRIGRRPVMIWPSLVYLVLIIPIFLWILATHSGVILLGGLTFLGFVGSLPTGAFYTALSESLPKQIRSRGFAATYSIAIAVCGGSTQLVITWLIHITGSPMAPAWYLLAATLVAFIATLMIVESAPVRRAGSVAAT